MELQQAATMGWLFFPFVLLLQHAWEKGTASENCSWENSSSYGENLDFFSEAQEYFLQEQANEESLITYK